MRLDQPLLQLPITFDAEALAAEVLALPASAWTPHPTGFAGNDAVLLVTPNGELDQGIEGPMAPTEHLLRCPYIMQAMAELGGVWGRSRLMGLDPAAEVPAHVDVNYYWRTHLRIHIPVITNPQVIFTCGDDSVHMKAGECWVFDSFRWHDVQNAGKDKRVHLVLDTVGSESIWDLVHAAGSPHGGRRREVIPAPTPVDRLMFEKVNVPKIMTPWEIRCHVAFIVEHLEPHPQRDAVLARLDKFEDAWAGAWARFGTSDQGVPTYGDLITTTRRDLAGLGVAQLSLRNELALPLVLDQLIFQMAIAPPESPVAHSAPQPAGERQPAS
jgi:hypothetical protein